MTGHLTHSFFLFVTMFDYNACRLQIKLFIFENYSPKNNKFKKKQFAGKLSRDYIFCSKILNTDFSHSFITKIYNSDNSRILDTRNI